jgi:hypothetical protein
MDDTLEVTYPRLAAEWDAERNGYALNDLTPGSNKLVWWKCAKGHSFDMRLKSRTRQTNPCCPFCLGRRIDASNRLTTTHPQLVKEWDCSKNTLKPEEVTYSGASVIWWLCPKGHSWQANLNSRTKKRYPRHCQQCPRVYKVRGSYYNPNRQSRETTVTRFLTRRILAGEVNYNNLVIEAVKGIKLGTLQPVASAVILHNLVKESLMKHHFTDCSTWRVACKQMSKLPIPRHTQLYIIHQELDIPVNPNDPTYTPTGKRRGRPRKDPALKKPGYVKKYPKAKRTITAENLSKLHVGLKKYHDSRKLKKIISK